MLIFVLYLLRACTSQSLRTILQNAETTETQQSTVRNCAIISSYVANIEIFAHCNDRRTRLTEWGLLFPRDRAADSVFA